MCIDMYMDVCARARARAQACAFACPFLFNLSQHQCVQVAVSIEPAMPALVAPRPPVHIPVSDLMPINVPDRMSPHMSRRMSIQHICAHIYMLSRTRPYMCPHMSGVHRTLSERTPMEAHSCHSRQTAAHVRRTVLPSRCWNTMMRASGGMLPHGAPIDRCVQSGQVYGFFASPWLLWFRGEPLPPKLPCPHASGSSSCLCLVFDLGGGGSFFRSGLGDS